MRFLLLGTLASFCLTSIAQTTANVPDPIEKLVLEAEAASSAKAKAATSTTQSFPVAKSPKIQHSSKPIKQKPAQPVEEYSDPEADQINLKPSSAQVADSDPTNGLAKLCDDGNIDSCLKLSQNYFYGMEIQQDLAQAENYAEKACQLGSGEGCAKVGFYLRRGLGTKMDPQAAKVFLAKACDLGNSAGCNDLADMYMQGLGIEKSSEEAKKYYEIACRQDNVAACRSLEDNFGISKVALQTLATPPAELPAQTPKDINASALTGVNSSETSITLAQACDMNSGDACSQLSNEFLTGKGQEQSDAKAFLMAQKACDLNFALGCYQLGYMYREGIGTTKSGTKMKKLYEKGCLLGAPSICAALGHEYLIGEKIRLSYDEAKKYYGKACDMDDEDACKAYASIVKQGK